MTLGEKIKLVLAEQERSQSWLARKAGTTSASVSRTISGSAPLYTLAMKLAIAIGEDPLWMLDDTLGPDDRPPRETSP